MEGRQSAQNWPRDLLLGAINDTVEAHSCVDNSEVHL